MVEQTSPRRRNDNDAGHAHELTFSCYHGFKFLAAERTCQWLAASINEARSALKFDLWAFVFMPEHVHLIVHPQNTIYDVADIKKAIRAPVARQAIQYLERNSPEWIPRISRTRGAKVERLFWQSGGGYDRNVAEPSTLLKMIDYLHLYPVRRGLVEMPADWKWSSARWFIDLVPAEPVLDAIPPEWSHLNSE